MLTAMKLALAATVAALSIAAVTSARAAVDPGSAGETVGQAVARAQPRHPATQPTQCWITADDNDYGTFGYWGSCSSPTASAASAPARPAFELQAQARRKCEEDLGYGRTGLFGCGGQLATGSSQGGRPPKPADLSDAKRFGKHETPEGARECQHGYRDGGSRWHKTR